MKKLCKLIVPVLILCLLLSGCGLPAVLEGLSGALEELAGAFEDYAGYEEGEDEYDAQLCFTRSRACSRSGMWFCGKFCSWMMRPAQRPDRLAP